MRRFSVIAGFSFLVILLIFSAVNTSREVGVLVASQGWVAHSRQVSLALEQIGSLLADAETGQRGYLLTNEAKYLKPYEASIAQMGAHLDALEQLTVDNPAQQAHVAALRSLTHLKLDEMAETIALDRSGKHEEAIAVVLSDRGLSIMNDLRHEIDRMQEQEASLEAARNAMYQRSIRITIASIAAATSVAAIGLILLAVFILRERHMREYYSRELEAQEERLRVTLTSIGDAVIATDAEGKVTFLNPVAEALTGISLVEARGMNIQTVFPILNEFTGKAAENPVNKVMQLGVVVGLANHTVLKHRDGHLVPIEDSAAPIRNDRGKTIGCVLVFHDVTAERNSQEVLRKTEKLAAAARLSATVAHEINNPLEAVMNLIFIAKTSPDASPIIRQQLDLAEQELDRVAHITRQTLGFYRDSNLPEEIDLSEVVDSVLKIYSNKILTKNIHVEHRVKECPPVWGVSSELKQVISNLLSNAIDAVSRGGHIAICCTSHQAEDGVAAEMVIEDDGPGVSPEHTGRIFDPFFTTKKDVGTGLGLWVTHEIVSRHGGSIQIRPSSAGQGLGGAAFVVHFPRANQNLAENPTITR
jgi:PAS domain S-box-containing protein